MSLLYSPVSEPLLPATGGNEHEWKNDQIVGPTERDEDGSLLEARLVEQARKRAEERADVMRRQSDADARRLVEQEVNRARHSARAAAAGRSAAKWALSLAAETAEAVTCYFDPEEGFARNAAAR